MEEKQLSAPPAPERAPETPPTQEPAQSETASPKKTHRSDCDLTRFKTVTSQIDRLYVYVHPEDEECGVCRDLDKLIADADIKTPIVSVPGDTCHEIADELGVDVYPTVALMKEGVVVKVHKNLSPEKIVQKMMRGR